MQLQRPASDSPLLTRTRVWCAHVCGDCAEVIGLMGKAQAAKVLDNMDDARVGAYLSNAKGKDATALVNAMDTDKVAGALSTMKGKSAAKMLSSLDAEGADAVMHKMDVVQVRKRSVPCETWCC